MLEKDATLKAQLEEKKKALQACEASFHNIIARSADGIAIIDRSGFIRFVNPAAEAIFSRNREDLLGKPFGFPVATGGATELEILQRGKKASIVEMRVVETEWQGRPAYLATLHDITDRKRREEQLRVTTDRLHSILGSITDAYYAVDSQWRFLEINSVAERVFQRPAAELLGKVLWEEYPQAVGLEFYRQFEIAVTEKKPVHFEAASAISGRWYETHAYPRGADMLEVFFRDITQRKWAEEALAAHASELEAANRELEAFNYTVSHDLRKPLSIINGYCQTIRELCGDRLDPECSRYLDETYEGTLRMNRLIDALLRFSHLTRSELNRQTIDLSTMAEDIFHQLSLAEPHRRVSFHIEGGMIVSADQEMLRVVLENLLGNAWKYTAGKADATIEFGVTEREGKPAYFVWDNGAGFDMAYAEKMFVPFQRLPGTEKYEGYGIGLATVERIIRRHGGKIWGEGEPGKGATFYFTLG